MEVLGPPPAALLQAAPRANLFFDCGAATRLGGGCAEGAVLGGAVPVVVVRASSVRGGQVVLWYTLTHHWQLIG